MKEVVIPPIDDDDLDWRRPETAGGVEPSETAADDDHSWGSWILHAVPSMKNNIGSRSLLPAEVLRFAERTTPVGPNDLCDGAADQDIPGIEVIETLERLDVPFTGGSVAGRRGTRPCCASMPIPSRRSITSRKLSGPSCWP
mgnify:CR=1 FL=1